MQLALNVQLGNLRESVPITILLKDQKNLYSGGAILWINWHGKQCKSAKDKQYSRWQCNYSKTNLNYSEGNLIKSTRTLQM